MVVNLALGVASKEQCRSFYSKQELFSETLLENIYQERVDILQHHFDLQFVTVVKILNKCGQKMQAFIDLKMIHFGLILR